MLKKNNWYSYEIKMKAVEMKLEGHSVKEIQNTLGIKSESQVYTWYYWYRDKQLFRFNQGIGKQYSFGDVPEDVSKEESLMNSNKVLKAQVELLKKYREL